MRPDIKTGDKARCTITGFTGVVVATTDWLNGCRRVTIQPEELKDGKPIDTVTFDVEQLELIESSRPAQTVPTGGPSITPTRNADPV